MYSNTLIVYITVIVTKYILYKQYSIGGKKIIHVYSQQKKVVKYTQNKLVASQKPIQPVMPGSKFSIIYLDV